MTENAANTHRIDKVRILLITNRDSDNVGDQVIEACDVALIKTAIRNMGLPEEGLTISSRALGMIPARYFKTNDRNLLNRAYDEISACDLVLFGGAPVFNYKYQLFYKHTLTILSIAKEYGKPVLFSAIGIDSYDESARCQELKAELHNGTVKQITTRDGIDHLRKYASMPSDSDNDSPSFPISLVADPAVLAKEVFANSSDTPPSTKYRSKQTNWHLRISSWRFLGQRNSIYPSTAMCPMEQPLQTA